MFLLLCSHGEHHQESRLPCHTNTKQPASMHQLQSSWLLSAFVVLHMHMDICCTSSEAVASQHQPQSPRLLHAQRSCDTLDNLKRSCSLRCQHQGRSRPDGIARVVSTKRVALFQAMHTRRRKQRSRAVASALVLLSTATIEAETKDAAGPRRHCTWCARI